MCSEPFISHIIVCGLLSPNMSPGFQLKGECFLESQNKILPFVVLNNIRNARALPKGLTQSYQEMQSCLSAFKRLQWTLVDGLNFRISFLLQSGAEIRGKGFSYCYCTLHSVQGGGIPVWMLQSLFPGSIPQWIKLGSLLSRSVQDCFLVLTGMIHSLHTDTFLHHTPSCARPASFKGQSWKKTS